MKYCLPIIKKFQKDIITTIDTNQKAYPYFEIWLDYIEDCTTEFISALIADYDGKLILVFRRQQLDNAKMGADKMHKIIQLCNNRDIYVDLDIQTQSHELDFISSQKMQIKSIVSYHNYTSTPPDEKLYAILDHMKTYSPTVYKIATFCNNDSDAIRLMQILLQLRNKKVRYNILGMGNHGLMTRVFGPLWGNDVIFAPLDQNDATAPGQITRHALDTILDLLEK